MTNTLHILIIDDDDVDRMSVRRALKSVGLDIQAEDAADGDTGLRLLREQSFDCAFLDYLLPGSDGMQVLKAARNAGVTTPIVVLTGHGDERLAVELMQAGATDYLPKGKISPEGLTHILQHAMRLSKAEAERRAFSSPSPGWGRRGVHTEVLDQKARPEGDKGGEVVFNNQMQKHPLNICHVFS